VACCGVSGELARSLDTDLATSPPNRPLALACVRPTDLTRNGLRRSLFTLTLLLVLAQPTLAHAAQKELLGSSNGPTWTSYFYPARVGRTCQETLHSGGVTGTETLRVSDVTPTPQGTQITVDEGSDTQVDGKSIPTNAALHYTITNNGDLVSSPSSDMIGGVAAQLVGNTVLPSVKRLMSGGVFASTLHMLVPLSQSDLSQLSGALKPGQKSMDIALSIRERGSLIPTLAVPLGRFRDVLDVTTTLGRIDVTNAVKSAAGALASALRSDLKKEVSYQTWYAKDNGPVQFELSGVVAQLTSCTG
jgi:hypothetical protein